MKIKTDKIPLSGQQVATALEMHDKEQVRATKCRRNLIIGFGAAVSMLLIGTGIIYEMNNVSAQETTSEGAPPSFVYLWNNREDAELVPDIDYDFDPLLDYFVMNADDIVDEIPDYQDGTRFKPMVEELTDFGVWQPREETGTGDAVITNDILEAPCIIQIDYTGTGPFTANLTDTQGNVYRHFASADGNFSGAFTNFPYYREMPTDIEIKCSGDWRIKFSPLADMERAQKNKTYTGDQVLYIDEETTEKVTFDYKGEDKFFVEGVSMMDHEIALDEQTGPGTWTIDWTHNQTFFIVHATGEWSMSWQ